MLLYKKSIIEQIKEIKIKISIFSIKKLKISNIIAAIIYFFDYENY